MTVTELRAVREAVYIAGVNHQIHPRDAAQLADDVVRDLRPTDFWSGWRRCPTCHAPLGEACLTVSRTILNGRPAGTARRLDLPHKLRQRRTV